MGGITANLIGSLSDTRAWKNTLEPSTTIYSWAMNNHWHTNYRAEQDGPTVFRYFIVPHENGFDADGAARLGAELSQPLLVLPARGEKPKPRRISVNPSTVQITAYKPSDDGKALIVRLFGASGKDEKVKLDWTAPKPATAWLSDNSEQPRTEAGESRCTSLDPEWPWNRFL